MSVTMHVGDDPRNFFEFSELRNEINKMNHPAASPVDFMLVESLALELFNKNGVDLQTAIYYTYAQTHLIGLAGFVTGCDMVAKLIVNHWHEFWPMRETARIDLFDWLNCRIGDNVRHFPFTVAELPLLRQVEKPLEAIVGKLTQEKLKKTVKINELYHYIKNTRLTLEKRLLAQQHSRTKTAVALKPSSIISPVPASAAIKTSEVPHLARTSLALRFKGWFGFILGIVFTAILVALLSFFSSSSRRVDEVDLSLFSKNMEQSLSSYRAGNKRIFPASQRLLDEYADQLMTLMQLSPLATRYYGDNLVRLSGELWPDNPQQQAFAKEWQAQLALQSNDRFMRDNYFHAQQLLSLLLDELEYAEKHHQTVTLSHLKTSAFAIQKQLDQDVPLEELLRQLSSQSTPSPVLLKTIDERFDRLLSYYHQLLQEQAG